MNEQQAAQRAYDLMLAIERDERGNPFTLEDTIRSVILKDPGFSSHRNQALEVLYTLLGSGIGWCDGRLGDDVPNNYINMPPRPGWQGAWSESYGRTDSLDVMTAGTRPAWRVELEKQWDRENQERTAKAIATIESIDQRCQQYSPKPWSWYPISWYGCNLCAPADAQEDFLDGAIETASLILETEHEVGTRHWRDHFRTKRHAEEILSALLARKAAVTAGIG
jgi:hypothetical protein